MKNTIILVVAFTMFQVVTRLFAVDYNLFSEGMDVYRFVVDFLFFLISYFVVRGVFYAFKFLKGRNG